MFHYCNNLNFTAFATPNSEECHESVRTQNCTTNDKNITKIATEHRGEMGEAHPRVSTNRDILFLCNLNILTIFNVWAELFNLIN